jgi:hypothetical protein
MSQGIVTGQILVNGHPFKGIRESNLNALPDTPTYGSVSLSLL